MTMSPGLVSTTRWHRQGHGSAWAQPCQSIRGFQDRALGGWKIIIVWECATLLKEH